MMRCQEKKPNLGDQDLLLKLTVAMQQYKLDKHSPTYTQQLEENKEKSSDSDQTQETQTFVDAIEQV